MSWSISAVIPAGSDEVAAARVLDAAALDAQQQAGEWGPETRHQVQSAVDAAAKIAGSGALGHLDLLVALSGHANAGHDPHNGFSLDTVSINLHQKSQRVA